MVEDLLNLTKKYLSSFSGLPKVCWPRILLCLVNTASGGVTFFLAFYFVKTLQINIVTAGAMISCYGLGTIFGGYVGGKLADRYSPFYISFISLICKASMFFMLIILTNPCLLTAVLFVLGLFTYILKTANNAFVLSHCKQEESERLKAINILYTASNLGIGFSAVIVSVLSPYGFKNIFTFSGLLLLSMGIYLFFQHRNSDNSRHRIVEIKAKPEGESAQKDNRIVILSLSALFLIGLIIAQLGTTYPIYLHDLFPTMGLSSSGYLFIVNAVLIIFFQVPLVGYFKKHNKILMMGLGGFLYGLGMCLLSVAVYYWIAVLACLIESVGEMLFVSLAQLVCYQYADEHKKGESLGWFQSVFAASVVVGPYAGSLIYHHFGGKVIWYSSGIIGIICLLSCLIFVFKKIRVATVRERSQSADFS